MRILLFLLLPIFVLSFQISADDAAPDARALIGTWKVDLRPAPDADEYYKEFVVTGIEGNTFTGSFYDSEIQHGRINTAWGKVYFAFVTSDGNADYNSAGVLEGEAIRGTTHSLGRGFLSVWTAERVQ